MNPKQLFWITLFALSMAYFEAAVVVYIRELIYPGGFGFPLQPITGLLATTEIFREAFSLLMLLSVGVLAGKNNMERFAAFLFSFAVWDIFYYVFLKLLLGWPESLMTMDVLFLLPIVWVGPVICPVILSILMIILSLMIIRYPSGSENAYLKPHELVLLISGSLVVMVSFMLDFSLFVARHYSIANIWSVPMKDLFDLSYLYDPQQFYWAIFWVGVALIVSGLGSIGHRIWHVRNGSFKET